MRQTYETYKLAKWIDKQTLTLTPSYSRAIKFDKTYHIETNKVIGAYTKKSQKSELEVGKIIKKGIENGYLSQIINTEKNISYIEVNSIKGSHLIDSIWKIPLGLIDEQLRQFNITVAFILGLFSSGIIATIGYGIWYLFKIVL